MDGNENDGPIINLIRWGREKHGWKRQLTRRMQRNWCEINMRGSKVLEMSGA